jgi:pullulanase
MIGTFEQKIERYRQTMMMQTLLPGKILYIGGVEILYTKPADKSGQDYEKHHTSKNAVDFLEIGNLKFHENTYKTTDYSAGFR